MKKISTVTIGIPAFNEENNIGHLISDIFKQNEKGYRIKEVIIVSDGSSDKTVEVARKSTKNKKLYVVDNRSRKGKSYRMNQILKMAQSDVLVLLDADILIKDKKFISNIIKPIVKGNADLTSGVVEELSPRTFFENVLYSSTQFKKKVYESYNKGNNLYTCHGRVRAFSKRFYKVIKFHKEIVSEDAYSYLYCTNKGFKYRFAKDARIQYRLPASFADHEKQSLRFIQTQKQFVTEFGKEFVDSEYKLPFKLTLKSLISFVLSKPLYIIPYIIIFGYMRIISLIKKETSSLWEVSISSKLLNLGVIYEWK